MESSSLECVKRHHKHHPAAHQCSSSVTKHIKAPVDIVTSFSSLLSLYACIVHYMYVLFIQIMPVIVSWFCLVLYGLFWLSLEFMVYYVVFHLGFKEFKFVAFIMLCRTEHMELKEDQLPNY